mgnify:CR=1 FL=1
MGTLRIDTLGTSFVMQANEDEEYLNKLMDYYKKVVNQVEIDSKLKDPLKTAIIAGFLWKKTEFCDRLYERLPVEEWDYEDKEDHIL